MWLPLRRLGVAQKAILTRWALNKHRASSLAGSVSPRRTSRGILITAFLSVHLWLIGLSLAIASTIVLLLALMNPVSAESPLTFVLNWHRNVGNISSNSKIKEVR
jgi:hypothetical protein